MPPRKKTKLQRQEDTLPRRVKSTLPVEVQRTIFKLAILLDEGVFKTAATLSSVGKDARTFFMASWAENGGDSPKEGIEQNYTKSLRSLRIPNSLLLLKEHTTTVVIDRPGEEADDFLFPLDVLDHIFSILSQLPKLTVLEIGLQPSFVPQFIRRAEGLHMSSFSLVLRNHHAFYTLAPEWFQLPFLHHVKTFTFTALPRPRIGEFSEDSPEQSLSQYAHSMPSLRRVFINLESHDNPTYDALVTLMFGPLIHQLEIIVIALPDVSRPREFVDWLDKWHGSLPDNRNDLEKLVVLKYQPPPNMLSSPWNSSTMHMGVWYLHSIMPDELETAFAVTSDQSSLAEHMLFTGNTDRFGMDNLLDIWKWAERVMRDRNE
ncbi:hypothetical protein DL96DRAFT_1717981 [Flagelloscypha sp. PMI_526]|nr:hypothetical protein DL96DRAFT_1717981 [Flagelloscypha sp. PMI_526]